MGNNEKTQGTLVKGNLRRQRGSVVRAGALNPEDLGSNPQLRLLNEFVFGDPRGKFTKLCKEPTGLPPTSWDNRNWERGEF